jgi:endonuclease III
MSHSKGRGNNYFSDVTSIANALSRRYANHAHGNKANPLRELLFIICSVQTNEALYQSTYTKLLSRFPKFSDLADAAEGDIVDVIAHGGLGRQKAHNIKAILSRLRSDFGDPTLVPLRELSDSECEAYLESLPGVGRKTARCVMMYSLGREVFPVDSNCWRIASRLGWVRPTRPDRSCSPRDMNRVERGIPPHLRFNLHVNLVSHGRKHCLPSKPLCGDCCIRQFCKFGNAGQRAAPPNG